MGWSGKRRGPRTRTQAQNRRAPPNPAHPHPPPPILSVGNPNRMTINLRPGGRNGSRIEIFVNGRRSESIDGGSIFLCSELVRQVTLGAPTLQDPNVARMVVGEYQHFFTYREGLGGGEGGDERGKHFRANVLTAVYADAQQDADLFNDVLGDPVICYSHNIIGKRV